MTLIRVLHFSKIINRNDFIDVIIRHANAHRFKMMAATYNGKSNIEDPIFHDAGIESFDIQIEHSLFDMFRGGWRLARLLRKNSVDILHTHHYYESIIGRIACWIHPRCKHIIGRHYHNQFYLTASGFKLWYYLFVEKVVNHFAAGIIVPSTEIVTLLKQQRTKTRKVHMIPYCFDFKAARYQPISTLEIEQLKATMGWNAKFVIGNIGRHSAIKGQSILLKAFKSIQEKIPESLLVMVGDGPMYDSLKKEAEQLTIEGKVQFLGWRRDRLKLVNAIDVVVHPTLQEAFPQIMIETMALAKPLIITSVSGATDVIKHGVNGLLISLNSVEAIVESVIQIYSSGALGKTLSDNAYRYVREKFTIEKIIPEIEKVYQHVARK